MQILKTVGHCLKGYFLKFEQHGLLNIDYPNKISTNLDVTQAGYDISFSFFPLWKLHLFRLSLDQTVEYPLLIS